MKICTNELVPHPMAEDIRNSEVWKEKELVFQGGEKILLQAGSGKGKTTFLSMLYGIRDDYYGNIFFDGQKLFRRKAAFWSDIRKNKLSIVFQDLKLFPDLTALENIQLKNRMLRHYDQDTIYELAAALEVDNHLNKPLKNTSLGQQQRIAFIRALCQPFDFILLDEPFSHLDTENTRNMMEILLQQAEKNRAGILLTALEYHPVYEGFKTLSL